MHRIPRFRVPIRAAFAGLGLFLTPTLAFSADCAGFKWDVSRERALFATAPAEVSAGTDAATAPAVDAGAFYRLALHPQETVRLAATPGKRRIADGAFAGLARFRAPAAGRTRVALSEAAWIDVVADGTTIPSDDFSGSPNCATPRKVVVYTLPAGAELVLQLTGSTAARIDVAITPEPASVPAPSSAPAPSP